MILNIVEHPSPNHAPRGELPVDILVLHYTELPLKELLDILSDDKREGRVSAHYVLAEDGTAYRLVPEERTAWHAGKSYWRGRESLNATSIGIEIVNLHGDRHDYPALQIAALIELCAGILARHPHIEPRNVVGHSDIAPQSKIDPGRRFPWADTGSVRHRPLAAAAAAGHLTATPTSTTTLWLRAADRGAAAGDREGLPAPFPAGPG